MDKVLGIVVALAGAFIAAAILASVGQEKAADSSRAKATEEAHQLPAPGLARLFVQRCVEDQELGPKTLNEAGYTLSLSDGIFAVPDESIAPVVAHLLSACAERFVLAAGTLDEMQSRAEMLDAQLSDEFRDEALALALADATRGQ